MKRFILVAALAAIAIAQAAHPAPSIPQCPEDAVLVGAGQFEHGRYTAYECGPAVDDYEGN